MKRTVSLFLTLVIILGSMSALATDAEPYDVSTNRVSYKLDFVGGNAVCTVNCTGRKDVTKINIVMTLQELNDSGTYTVVEQWTQSTQGRTASMSKQAPAVSGKNYRLEVNAVFFTATGNVSKQASVTKRCP